MPLNQSALGTEWSRALFLSSCLCPSLLVFGVQHGSKHSGCYIYVSHGNMKHRQSSHLSPNQMQSYVAQLFCYSPEAAVSEIAETQRNLVPFPEVLIPRQVYQSSCGWKLFCGVGVFSFQTSKRI